MTASAPKHAVIVGGGITGLSAAFYLARKARERGLPLRITLIESDARLGGKVVTERIDGFTIEGGPDSFVTDKQGCLRLCHDLGLDGELMPSNQKERKIYVLKDGRLLPFPGGFRLTIPTEILPFVGTRLISWPGKFRMALDLVKKARRENSDESLGNFVRRRFGQEAVDLFGGPLMAGIFTADPERLSLKASFPRFADMERKYGSLIRGAKAMKRNPPPRPPGMLPAAGGAMFNSLRSGVGTMVDAILRQTEASFRAGVRCESLRREGSGFVLQTTDGELRADAVLLACPASASAKLLEPLHAPLAGRLRSVWYVSTANVSLGYRLKDIPADRPLDGYGVVLPSFENRKLIACTWSSTKFPGRAPEGSAMMRAFVGGHKNEALATLPDAELLELIRREYREMFGIVADPVVSRIHRWPSGNPQYDVGHLDRVAEMEKLAAEIPGLQLAGSSYRGVGMPDCVQTALTAIDRILATLQ